MSVCDVLERNLSIAWVLSDVARVAGASRGYNEVACFAQATSFCVSHKELIWAQKCGSRRGGNRRKFKLFEFPPIFL